MFPVTIPGAMPGGIPVNLADLSQLAWCCPDRCPRSYYVYVMCDVDAYMEYIYVPNACP
jgi:hypothetical protein